MKTKVSFQNSKKNSLVGILSDPMETKRAPLIILCHGLSTSKDGRTYSTLEEKLNSYGFSTLRFDFFGHGESEGLFEELTISEAVDDITNAKNFVKKRGYKKLGLFGSSFGGMAGILAVSQTDDFRLLGLKSPVSDYHSLLMTRYEKKKLRLWKEKGYIEETDLDGNLMKLNYTYYQDMKKTDVYSCTSKIMCKTLMVHGDKDETVPVEQSEKTARLIRDCGLEIIEGADHIYSNPKDFERMIFLISDFFLKNF